MDSHGDVNISAVGLGNAAFWTTVTTTVYVNQDSSGILKLCSVLRWISAPKEDIENLIALITVLINTLYKTRSTDNGKTLFD